MNTADLRAELRNQSEDIPDPAALFAALSHRRALRRSRFAAGGLAAAVVVIVAVGAAISGRSTPPAEPGAPTIPTTSAAPSAAISTFELVCQGAIDVTSAPAEDLAEVLGVVAFDTSTQEVSPNFQQLAPGERMDPARRYFGKSGLQVKVGNDFRIEVPAAWRGRAEIGWSKITVTPADVMTVPACPPPPSANGDGSAGARPDQWLTYPGGIWVSAPACVPLQVITPTASATIRIPAGKPCP